MRNLDDADQAEHAEPEDHHRPEQIADDLRTEALNGEKQSEHHDADRQDQRA
jgi:hypothetical protein